MSGRTQQMLHCAHPINDLSDFDVRFCMLHESVHESGKKPADVIRFAQQIRASVCRQTKQIIILYSFFVRFSTFSFTHLSI